MNLLWYLKFPCIFSHHLYSWRNQHFWKQLSWVTRRFESKFEYIFQSLCIQKNIFTRELCKMWTSRQVALPTVKVKYICILYIQYISPLWNILNAYSLGLNFSRDSVFNPFILLSVLPLNSNTISVWNLCRNDETEIALPGC